VDILGISFIPYPYLTKHIHAMLSNEIGGIMSKFRKENNNRDKRREEKRAALSSGTTHYQSQFRGMLPGLTYTQLDANKVYEELFEKISTAYKQAGDQFVLLIGEEHHSCNSALLTCMILDIASRLGIKHAAIEQNEAGAQNLMRFAGVVNGQIDQLTAPAKGRVAGHDNVFMRGLQYIEHLRNEPSTGGDPRQKIYRMPNQQRLLPHIISKAINIHAGDPLQPERLRRYGELVTQGRHQDPQVLEEVLGDPALERPMAEALHQLATQKSVVKTGDTQKGGVVGWYGLSHIPEIERIFKEEYGISPLVIDASASRQTSTMSPRRREQIAHYYAPEKLLDVSGPPIYFALAMAEEASMAHRVKSGAMDVATAQLRSSSLNRVTSGQSVSFGR
jgi:hypothetical protein